jgi:hypothetical protein
VESLFTTFHPVSSPYPVLLVFINIWPRITWRDSPARFFTSAFFHGWTPPKPLTHYLKPFLIWLWIWWDIHNFWLALRYYSIYSRKLISPVSFTRDSPHRFSGESRFVRIICKNSRLSFNTESWYCIRQCNWCCDVVYVSMYIMWTVGVSRKGKEARGGQLITNQGREWMDIRTTITKKGISK